jgi:predicted dehydrogenase
LDSSYSADPNLLEIYGTRGYIRITKERLVELQLDEPYQGEYLQCPAGSVAQLDCPRPQNSPTEQHRAFVEAMLAGHSAPIPGEVGLRDLRIVEAVYRSAKTGKIVNVEGDGE